MQSRRDLYRSIPPVESLLSSPSFAPLLDAYPREQVLRRLREVLDALRDGISRGALAAEDLAVPSICRRTAELLEDRFERYYRRVINGTGVVLHTNLGRAPLAAEAAAALAELAPHPQRLEVDLKSGDRGGRDDGCAGLLVELLSCEAATVVNNNAAATLLILGALARDRQVVVSRGELVEIGGSYRIPEILRESGAVLREVGTTNRTHLRDYEETLVDAPALLLKVHTSNYRVVGFTAEVGLAELVAIGRSAGVPVVHDLGSGSLVDLAARGLPYEDQARSSIEAGADLVCFSGDKLLGGPQAGIIAGRSDLVDRCRAHPLFRTVRPGRLVYTALEATLKIYLLGEATAVERIPPLRSLLISAAKLEDRAARLVARLEPVDGIELGIVAVSSQAGSGSMPARELASTGVRIRPRTIPLEALTGHLRCQDPAIVGRSIDDALVLDVRTLEDEELDAIGEGVQAALAELRGVPGVPAPAEGA